MEETRKIIRVFLASPGDLVPERRLARNIVDEVNGDWAKHVGYQLELVGWEDTVSKFGRPQSVINQDLETCELFVGLMWKHWGSSPSQNGEFTSGFEEEFTLSMRRRGEKGTPEISLFFKEIDADLLRDPGASLSKVVQFQENLSNSKLVLFQRFNDEREFEKKLRSALFDYIRGLQKKEQKALAEDDNAKTQSIETDPIADESPSSEVVASALAPISHAYLKTFIKSIESAGEFENLAAFEVARFRLLANSISKIGNDVSFVGVHDANLIFTQRDNIELGMEELAAITNCGLLNLRHENAPLWHWHAKREKLVPSYLMFVSVVGASDDLKVSALEAMRLLTTQVRPTEPLSRESFIESWLASDVSAKTRIAALRYLEENGLAEDLPFVKAEIGKADYQTSRPAIEALVAIQFREDRKEAATSVISIQFEHISASLLEIVLDEIPTLPDETLLLGLEHRNLAVRLKCFRALAGRRKLPVGAVQKMLEDGSAEARYAALLAEEGDGREVPLSEAGNWLKRKPEKLPHLFSWSQTDQEGVRLFEEYERARLKLLGESELEKLADESSPFDSSAYLALVDRYFPKYQSELRKNVDDRFERYFFYKNEANKRKNAGASFVETPKTTEDTAKKLLTRAGLDILCEKRDPADMHRVHANLTDRYSDPSLADVLYLETLGSYEDIRFLLIAAKPTSSGLMISRSDTDRRQHALKAVYRLGRGKLDELLTTESLSLFRAELIAELSNPEFRSLSDQTVSNLLFDPIDKVRKHAALRCVLVFSKRKIISLLDAYLSHEGQKYYNSIFWLDLGSSLTTKNARQVANAALK